MNSSLCLRFIGVNPGIERMEYGFQIEDKDKDPRLVVLMIESDFFMKHDLLRQEAPDLCYQKVLTALKTETDEAPISPYMPVSVTDITDYRKTHPVGKPFQSRKLRTANGI